MADLPDTVWKPSAVLLCDHGTPLSEVLRTTVAAAGFGIAGAVGRWIEVVDRTAALHPDVVVVDLALAGQVGFKLLATLQAIAPDCPVIVVLPLGVVDVGSLPAGAAAVVDPSDLRPLGAALRRIARGTDQVG